MREEHLEGDFTETEKKEVFLGGHVTGVDANRGPSKVRLRDGYVSMLECQQWKNKAERHQARPGSLGFGWRGRTQSRRGPVEGTRCREPGMSPNSS